MQHIRIEIRSTDDGMTLATVKMDNEYFPLLIVPSSIYEQSTDVQDKVIELAHVILEAVLKQIDPRTTIEKIHVVPPGASIDSTKH